MKGLREVQSALRQVNKAVSKDLREELKRAGEPVAASARAKLSRYQGASTNVRVHPLGKGVFVRQNARKVTGLRGDFGAVQMRHVFIPALDENQGRVLSEVEDALDRFADRAGF